MKHCGEELEFQVSYVYGLGVGLVSEVKLVPDACINYVLLSLSLLFSNSLPPYAIVCDSAYVDINYKQRG